MRAVLLLAAALLGGPAAAQTMQHTHGEMSALPPPNAAPATLAYQAAVAKMHQGMDIPMTGDADRDFVAGMIPHHQGAIDMAEVELRYGKNTELRQLAQEIVAAQQKEIALMRQWQAAHAK